MASSLFPGFVEISGESQASKSTPERQFGVILSVGFADGQTRGHLNSVFHELSRWRWTCDRRGPVGRLLPCPEPHFFPPAPWLLNTHLSGMLQRLNEILCVNTVRGR